MTDISTQHQTGSRQWGLHYCLCSETCLHCCWFLFSLSGGVTSLSLQSLGINSLVSMHLKACFPLLLQYVRFFGVSLCCTKDFVMFVCDEDSTTSPGSQFPGSVTLPVKQPLAVQREPGVLQSVLIHTSLPSSSQESKDPKLTSVPRHNGTSSRRILPHFQYTFWC